MFSEVVAFTMRQIAETQKRGVVTCIVLLSPDAGLDQERPMRRIKHSRLDRSIEPKFDLDHAGNVHQKLARLVMAMTTPDRARNSGD